MKNRKGKVRPKGFTLIEALVAIGIMVFTSAAILSLFLSSSDLRGFAAQYTRGINACQKELERIRSVYEQDTDLNKFTDLLDNYEITKQESSYDSGGGSFQVLNYNPDNTVNVESNFVGRVYAYDPYDSDTARRNNYAVLTARVAFRQGNRVVGGRADTANPATLYEFPYRNTPCQTSIILQRP